MSATPIVLPTPDNDVSDVIAKAPLFQDLPAAVIKTLAESCDRREYSAGQTVISMGQYDGSEFFVVLSGMMRVSIVDADTGAMFIEEVGRDKVFALELALSEGNAESFQQLSVTAENDLTLIAIDAAAFRGLAAQRPSLMRNIAMHFAQNLAARRFKSMSAEVAPEQRVFAALLRFVERDGLNGDWRVPRMPKHRELADEAGVEEAVTAAAVATLIQEGIAQRDYPGLIINDMARLNQVAG